MASPLLDPLDVTSRAPRVLSLVIALAALSLSGCQGCAAGQTAAAQAGDGGVPIVVVPVPIPQEPAPEPGAPATCWMRASSATTLVDTQITQLCVGAWSSAPVDCYLAARNRLRLTDEQQIALCRCADSDAPVDCHDRMTRDTQLTDIEIMQLCAPVTSLGLLANCRPLGN